MVAAINLAEPDFSPETPLHIDVDTESAPGETQGATVSVADLPPNVLVSLDPSFDNLDYDADEVFSSLDIPEADAEVESGFGSAENDLIDAADINSDFDGNNDILFTGSGNDLIDASQTFGHNRIYGGDGDDILLAGSNNRLVGDAGSDIFFVGTGEGDNLITGGDDADQFWILTDEADLPATANIITDFDRTEGDVIGLANTSLDFDDLTFTADGDNTVVSALSTDLAVLIDLESTQIGESDFAFI